jgi:hypothetical protein
LMGDESLLPELLTILRRDRLWFVHWLDRG